MTLNEKRIVAAKAALREYLLHKGEKVAFHRLPEQDQECMVVDLIADLYHLAHSKQMITPLGLHGRALDHFNAEVK